LARSAKGCRFHQQVTETAGFYNTFGFNHGARTFLSIPARHGVAHRLRFPAKLGSEPRQGKDGAFEVARELTYGLVEKAIGH
jgi:glucuronate isomerase